MNQTNGTSSPARPSVDHSLVSDDFRRLIPLDFAREHLVISQGVRPDGNELLLGSGRDADAIIAHNIAVRLGRSVELSMAPAESIAAALDALAQQVATSHSSIADSGRADQGDLEGFTELDESDIAELIQAEERDLLSTAGRAPIVKLLNSLLFEALHRRGSDIHIQPLTDHVLIRYRIDGVLFDARSLPRKLLLPIVSRVKVMAHMDIAERRLPQDGRTAVTVGDQEIDLRISSLPTAQGERVVIRLLDKRQGSFFDLEKLGMPESVRQQFEQVCTRSHGMVLVTGPTGSGKTTTLYSMLLKLNSAERNIMTLEDPIEYELPGISQSQVNLKKGVTFGTGLRHILRQDPDVIMVGEIRDAETARIAIQSSLTGHLVFSTLHTNSAASAVTRLSDLGVEPYLINASLSAVLAQRLCRQLCNQCRGTGVHSDHPCELCQGSGYRGRKGLFEFLTMSPRLQELIVQHASVAGIHTAARQEGMQTLRESGLEAIASGITTRSEVDRVTLIDEAITDPEIVTIGSSQIGSKAHQEGAL